MTNFVLSNNTYMAKKNFVILATQRTGSNYLESLLDSHTEIFCAGEILIQPHHLIKRLEENNFSHDLLDKFRYLGKYKQQVKFLKLFYRSEMNGHVIKGCRLFYHHLNFWKRRQVKLFINQNELKIIHLRRKNLLDSFISGKFAVQNKLYTTTGQASLPREKLNINARDLKNYFRHTENYIQKYDYYFRKQQVQTFYYEDLTENREHTMNQIMEFLEVETIKLESELKKINYLNKRDSIKTMSI